MSDAALRALRGGRIVAVATESFLGLLGDATLPGALDVLFSLKPRGADKGVGLLLPDRAAWAPLCVAVPPLAQRLADALWPGPLSIALAARAGVDARLLLDGRISVRLPGDSPAADLARAFGRPLSATSANLPGAPAATRSEAVRASFADAVRDGRLLVVDGSSPGGAPSTVVVVDGEAASIVRDGAVPRSVLAGILGASLRPLGPADRR